MQDRPPSSRAIVDASGGPSRFPTTLSATAYILLFYLFAISAFLLVIAVLAVQAMAGFLGGRFSWAFRIRKAFRVNLSLAAVFLRSWRLPRAAGNFVPLTPDDAPQLFTMLESLCFLRGIEFPPQVFVSMEAGAWVSLQGSSRAGEKVALGLGFDLLAGVTYSELEVIIAHELSHAKLTRRAVQNWLVHGLERVVQLSRGLSQLTAPRRGRMRAPWLARFFLGLSDSLAAAAAQRIAAFSRQQEFAADRGAAEVSGAELLRSALLKVESLARFSARLAWKDRVAQLQAQAFVPWLLQEFSQVKPMTLSELAARPLDRFSTHPPLRDRLNALPGSAESLEQPDARPAIRLLNDPDAVAERLMAKIQENSLEQEERDTRKLRRWVREVSGAAKRTLLQRIGAALLIAAEIAGITAWIYGAGIVVVAYVWGFALLGILFYWLGRRRENFFLPVPDFGLLKDTWSNEIPSAEEEIKLMEQSLQRRLASKNIRQTEKALAANCLEALAQTDYLKAAASARLLLKRNPRSLPGLIATAISSSWLGQGDETPRALAALQQQIGLRGRSVCWGAAWASMLRGNWSRAEALLEQVIAQEPNDPNLLQLRSLCQLRRGKIQSAIIGSRRACTPHARNREHAKHLVALLLEGGYVREARARLLPLDRDIPFDNDLMLSAIRLDLAFQNFEGAAKWAEALHQSAPPAHMIVQLAAYYELARQRDEAARFYREALALAFYPDACLGLARIETERGDIPAARQFALDALNHRKPLGKHATPPWELLQSALTQLALLGPSMEPVQAWIASLPIHSLPAQLAGTSFLVVAINQRQAERSLQMVLGAITGGELRAMLPNINWHLAPPQYQPNGAVRPGLQILLEGPAVAPSRRSRSHRLWWRSGYSEIQSIIEGMRLLPQSA